MFMEEKNDRLFRPELEERERPHPTDWEVGRGIKEDGGHDTSWNGRDTIGVTYNPTKKEWLCRIIWGSAWRHMVIVEHPHMLTALSRATVQAYEEGCPDEFLGGSRNMLITWGELDSRFGLEDFLGSE